MDEVVAVGVAVAVALDGCVGIRIKNYTKI